MVDLDIADMFLNFMLDEKARELVGVDVSLFLETALRRKRESNGSVGSDAQWV